MIMPLVLLSLGVSEATQILDRIPINITDTKSTTCEEFLNDTSFDEPSILDKNWKVFYTWCVSHVDPYQVKFRKPTPTLIDRFRVELRNSSIKPNWNDTAFFMESTIDLSALFIKTSTPGLFQVITSLAFNYDVNHLTFAMKVVDPGYLALMNCNIQVIVALAPFDKFPKDDELEDAAKLLKIRNPYGYPYNAYDATLKFDMKAEDHHDIDQDLMAEDMSKLSTDELF